MEMTYLQRKALQLMDERNLGCVFIGQYFTGGYVWPTHIRNDRGNYLPSYLEFVCTKVIQAIEGGAK